MADQKETYDKPRAEAIEMIEDERVRQIQDEGFDAMSDDRHDRGQLATLAGFYALPKKVFKLVVNNECFKYRFNRKRKFLHVLNWLKRKDKVRLEQLTVAGALIVAEMERVIRKQKRTADK